MKWTSLAATAGTMPKLPFGLKLKMFWLVAFFKQAMHTLEHYKVLVRREIAGLPLIDHHTFGIDDFLLVGVDLQRGSANIFLV